MGRKRRREQSVMMTLNADFIENDLPDAIKKKVYTYSDTNNLKLSSDCKIGADLVKSQWGETELLELKQKLCSVKSELNDVEIVRWHDHTCCTNPANNVIKIIRQSCYPEMCTQAWCKFFEILSNFNLLSDNCAHINSLHLCEAPGAFIASLNHYFKLLRKLKLSN